MDFETAKELEQLRAKIKYYEEQVKPLADRELNRVREEQVKAYNLTEEQKQVMRERLAEVDQEEAIKETALQLAGQFRATEKRYVEPSMGNGAVRRTNSTRNSAYEKGVQAVQNLHGRNGKKVSSIHVPQQSTPKHAPPKRNGLLGRVFGRKA